MGRRPFSFSVLDVIVGLGWLRGPCWPRVCFVLCFRVFDGS